MPDLAPTPTALELEILIALGQGPRHGYAIIQDIEGRTSEFGNLRSGTLYLALRRLRKSGAIEACDPPEAGADARRKFVRITERGRRAAREELTRMRRRIDVAVERALFEAGRP